jgi:HAD superfamily hydrolase (TIGR01549 family)
MNRIQFIFLDVGNVIFTDDVAVAYYSWRLFQYIRQEAIHNLSFEHFLEERESLALGDMADSASASERVGENYLGKEGIKVFRQLYRADAMPHFDKLTPLLPGIQQLLECLQTKASLGLIANQPAECADSLKRRGLWQFFAVHGLSDIVGMYKPDPEFFLWACRQAQQAPTDCLMIGDRWDNDILAARGIGMIPVWLRWQNIHDKGISPTNNYEHMYFESVNRVYEKRRSWPPGHTSSDHVVHSVAELATLLAKFVHP